MFVTSPDMQQWVPPQLAPDGASFWRGIALANCFTPWYVLSYETQEEGAAYAHTVLLAWEQTLRSALDDSNIRPLSVYCASVVRGTGMRWVLRQVAEIWLPSEQELGDTGPLIFLLMGESTLLDSHFQPVAPRAADRRMLASFLP
jgi:hypothetical protein